MKRIRRSPEDARAEILAAVQAALAKLAWSELTVDEVMRRTGMTRSSFYHYFSGLDALALALLEQFERDVRASVDAWLEHGVERDPEAATRTHLTAMFEVMEQHRPAVRAFAQAAGGHPAVYRQWQDRVLDYFIRLTEGFIRREIARGRSRVADPARLANALILMNNAVAMDNLARETPDDPAAVAGVLADVWNAAIYDGS